MGFKDKVCVVTGAAQGIGYACAQRFASEGAKVVIADIDEKKGEAARADLGTSDENKLFVHCNVAERLDVRNLITESVDSFGQIDVLINNAGITFDGSFLEITEDDFDRVLQINLKGAFLVGQAIAKQMVKQIEDGEKPGTIINMSSVNAVFAIARQVPYSISKGGINQLTKVMSLSLAEYGIRVNAIGPGSIMTDMLKTVVKDSSAREKVLSRTPMLRIGEPSEVAAVAAFLASEDASYMTGQTLYVDGGRLPLNYTVAVEKPED